MEELYPMIKTLILNIITVSFLGYLPASQANTLLEAEEAVKNGAPIQVYQHLEAHPLYPFVLAEYFKINTHQVKEITAFLRQYPDASFSAELAKSAYPLWVNQNPQAIIYSYSEHFANPEINCLLQQALSQTGQALRNVKLDENCPQFLNPTQLRDTFQKLMRENKRTKASALLSYFSGNDLVMAQEWLNGNEFLSDPVWRSMVTAERIYQLSAKQVHEALILADSQPLNSVADYERAYNRLVSKLAKDDHPDAYRVWLKMPAGSQVDNTIFDIIAYTLRRNDWGKIPELMATLNDSQKNKPEIQYWLGKAAEKTGNQGLARQHYQKASQERDYFGFLAAEKLGIAPQMKHQPIRYQPQIKAKIGDGVYRALILRQLGKNTRALQELQAVSQARHPEEIEQIALYLHQNGWHIQAISILARGKLWDALEVRFPTKYLNEVKQLARQHGLKPSQIFAIIRKESIFQENIKSSAGAIGLMQVMPRTAMDTAKKYGIPYSGVGQLTDPHTNLAIGTQYLVKRLDEFGHLGYAAAAYNAGAKRAHEWLARFPNLPMDEWIAQIPFNETRDYVKKVLEYEKIYEYLLNH